MSNENPDTEDGQQPQNIEEGTREQLVVNKRPSNTFDEMPLAKPKTFEELLQEELSKNGGEVIPPVNKPPVKRAEKKEFLKRKEVYQGIPDGKPNVDKNFKYYADNFTKEEKTSVPEVPLPPKRPQITRQNSGNLAQKKP